MKGFVFKRNTDNFADILSDKHIKKHIYVHIEYMSHLILLMLDNNDKIDELRTYITLKYGEDLVNFNDFVKDRTPVPNVDYVPKKKLVNGTYI